MVKMIVGRGLGSMVGAWWLAAALVSLTGCHTAGDPKEYADIPGMENVAATPEEVPLPPDDPTALIHIGDVLQVSFTDVPTALLPLELKVQDDGTIKLYYSEVFKAEGLTTPQLEKELHDRYVPKYYTRLTVMITHSKETRYYFVGGEVKSPGQKPYIGPIRLTQAIQAAGDFTDFAKKSKVQLTRANGNKLVINVKKGMNDSKQPDPWIHPGDKIHVPRSWL